MKAGRTGSNPGDVTKQHPVESDALRTLRKDIGSASFLLNTVVVGLDAVAKGHQKPDGIMVAWEPKDRLDAAKRARKFTVEAFIVRVAEALKAYQNTISKLPQFKSIRDGWNQDDGAAKKLDAICRPIITDEKYLVAAGKLLITWRNIVSHNLAVEFKKPDEKLLRANAGLISRNYAALEIDRLIVHMKEGRPTLKDVSSLISMAINLAVKIDNSVYTSLTKEDVFSLAEHYGIVSNVQSIRQETTAGKIESSIKRSFNSRATRLYAHFLKFYMADGSDFK